MLGRVVLQTRKWCCVSSLSVSRRVLKKRSRREVYPKENVPADVSGEAIIEYSDYNNNYSKQLIVFVSKPELNFELTYNKVEPRETDKVSFKIPERYDEVK